MRLRRQIALLVTFAVTVLPSVAQASARPGSQAEALGRLVGAAFVGVVFVVIVVAGIFFALRGNNSGPQAGYRPPQHPGQQGYPPPQGPGPYQGQPPQGYPPGYGGPQPPQGYGAPPTQLSPPGYPSPQQPGYPPKGPGPQG